MLALFRRQTVLIERTPSAWEWGTVEGWDEECRRLRTEVARLRERVASPPRPPSSITPGTLVSFQAGDHVCVGYVDSLDPVVAGFAANVTACKVQPGRWAREKNPSLDGALQSWRVPLGDLTPLPSPAIDPRPLGPRLRRKPPLTDSDRAAIKSLAPQTSAVTADDVATLLALGRADELPRTMPASVLAAPDAGLARRKPR